MSDTVSVILVNYNTSEYTNNCIQSLIRSDYHALEIIVVDNNSEEIEKNKLNTKTNVKYYFLDENKGFAGACNYGVGKSNGDYVLFLNNDTEVAEDSISLLVDAVNKSSVGAVTPQVRFFSDPTVIDRDTGEFDSLGYGWHPRQLLDIQDICDQKSLIETSWISGCAFFIRRSTLDNVGGFDEDFFMYCEDLELSIRLRKQGYKLLVVTDSVVYHKFSASTKGSNSDIDRSAFQIKHQSKNRAKILFKHYPLRHICIKVPLFILSNIYWCFVLYKKDTLLSAVRLGLNILVYAVYGLSERDDHGTDERWKNDIVSNGFTDYLRYALHREQAYNKNKFE